MSVTFVLDASAVIALARDEPGGTFVRELLESVESESIAAGLLSAVNLTEVLQVLHADPTELIDGEQSVITTVPFDAEQARIAAGMLETSRSAGLSLADRACLALARVGSSTAVTADRAWSEVDLGVEVLQIR